MAELSKVRADPVTLETDRLHLRPPAADDLDRRHGLIVSEEVRRFLDRGPPSLEDSFNRLLRDAGCWALFGWGSFGVIERASGAFVGSCGLFRGARGLGGDFDPFPEAGWVIGHEHWGHGYATEAMTAILAWFDVVVGGRTVCMIAPGNTASERLAARLGYEPIGMARYKDDEIMRYARDQC